MTREGNERCMVLLEDLLDLPAPQREAGFLDLTGEDPEVLEEVRARLQAFERAPVEFMAHPAQDSLIPALLPGQWVDGYRIGSLIGRGGMSRVYKAWDKTMERHVALKLILPSGADDLQSHERFLRELRAAAAVNHENVVTVHSDGVHRGLPYFVMEYLEGEDLSQAIENSRCGDAVWKINVALQLSGAFAAIHAAGALHRDIKPANIFVTTRGPVKVLDFGIARFGETKLTTTGLLAGTPEYLPPERLHGKPPDSLGDIYSFGLLVYELFTGSTPFRGAYLAEILQRVNKGDVPAEPLRRAGAPPRLVKLVRGCLSMNPRHRPASFRAIETELRTIAPRHFNPHVNRRALAAVAAGVAGLAAIGSALRHEAVPRSAEPPAPVSARTVIAPKADTPEPVEPKIVIPAPAPELKRTLEPLQTRREPAPAAPINEPPPWLPAVSAGQPVVPPMEKIGPPPPASPPDRSADRAELVSSVRELEQAYAGEDVNRIRGVWPTLTEAQINTLAASFEAGTVKLVLSLIGEPRFENINRTDIARWSCERTVTQALDRGPRPVSRITRVLLHFERRNAHWVLVKIG